MVTRRQQQARTLRRTRRVHRYSGISLFIFFAVIGVTSVLLGLKKNSDYLMPPTGRAATTERTVWLPVAELMARAQDAVFSLDAVPDPGEIDRLDIRPDRGIVKVLYTRHNLEVQLEGVTGRVISIGRRRSDLIENIHDGSILDNYFGTKFFKPVYSTLMGLAVLVFTVSGFWLWYGPKRMRRSS